MIDYCDTDIDVHDLLGSDEDVTQQGEDMTGYDELMNCCN
jgi:hypothetical protein